MDDTKLRRWAALGGIVFVILLIAGITISGSMPKASDSASKIYKYVQDNTDGIKVGSFLSILATIPILWWAGSLWTRLRQAEGNQPRLALVAVLGLVLGGAGNLAQTGVGAAVALQVKNISPSGAKFFFILGQTMGAGGTIGIAALVLATSALALQKGAFPAWLGWVGIVDGILFVIGSYTIATTSDGIAVFGFIGFLVWAIWIIATSVIMFRAPEVTAAS